MARPFVILAAALTALAIPATSAEIDGGAAMVLPRRPAASEDIVIVTSTAGGRTIHFRKREDAAAGPASLPFFVNLLEVASPVSFGSDRRCEMERSAQGLRLTCRPGMSVSGATLVFAGHRLPPGAAVDLQVTATGQPGFKAEVTLEGDDANALRELPDGIGRLPMGALSDGRAPQLVILAPPQGGTLDLTYIELVAADPRPVGSFSAWAWEPALWAENPEALVASAVERQVGRLFVTLEIGGGKLLRENQLRRFVRLASAAGIEVEAVEGDPRMVLAPGLDAALLRARAFAAYQRGAAAGEKLAGLQYDIEPYTLQEWGEEPAGYQGWAEAIVRLSEAAGEPVDLVLPFWLPASNEGAAFLAGVAPAVRGVTVMSYRTQAPLLAQVSEPFLAWGAQSGKPVRLALEAGPIADEVEEVYREAPVGTLALLDGPEPRAIFLDLPGAYPGARMFARQHAQTIRGDRISFLGDEARLLEMARQTAPAFSAWPSFAGFALHGLQWPASPER